MVGKTNLDGILKTVGGALTRAEEKIVHPQGGAVVSVIKLEGAIAAGKGGGLMGGGGRTLSLEGTRETIKEAFNRKGAVAVALSINSPGGSPVQSDLIAREIRYWAEKKNLPVFAFVEDVAASGGYWLACSADKIYGMPSSITGSIGVIGSGFGFNKLIDKLGIERRIFTAGDNKSKADPFRPLEQKDLDAIADLQTKIHDDFKKWVKSRRGDRLNAPDKQLMNGDYWTSPDSVKFGLIDGIGELQQTMRDEYGEDVNIAYPSAEKPDPLKLLKLLMGGGASAAFNAASTGNIGGAIVDRTLEQVEERTLWGHYGLTPPRP